MHLQIYLTLIFLVAQSVVAGVISLDTTSEDPKDQLFRRGIPTCKQLYGEAFEHPASKTMLSKAAYSLDHTVHYGKDGWRDPICYSLQTVCFSMAPGIKWDRPPPDPSRIGQDLGFWTATEDSSSLLAVKYWHNELGFSGNGGSAKIYPAHGFFFICVKGYVQVRILYSGSNGKGKTGSELVRPDDWSGTTKDPDGWNGPCKCFGDSRWDIQGSDIRIEWTH